MPSTDNDSSYLITHIKDLRNQGLSICEIAKELNISKKKS